MVNNGTKETGRVEAFSDGVFAIAITLLVLEIHVPPLVKGHNAAGTVWQQWPSFAGYAVSFLTILVMWMNHHTLFEMIHRIDRPFLFLNGILLMLITFINYPTALLAAYLQQPEGETFAALFYNGTFVAIALFFNILWFYASSNARLLSSSTSPSRVRSITIQYRLGPIAYLVAFLLAFVSAPASLITDLLIISFFCFTGIPGGRSARQRTGQEDQDQLSN